MMRIRATMKIGIRIIMKATNNNNNCREGENPKSPPTNLIFLNTYHSFITDSIRAITGNTAMAAQDRHTDRWQGKHRDEQADNKQSSLLVTRKINQSQ